MHGRVPATVARLQIVGWRRRSRSVTTPPASRTSRSPAATSHGCRSEWTIQIPAAGGEEGEFERGGAGDAQPLHARPQEPCHISSARRPIVVVTRGQ